MTSVFHAFHRIPINKYYTLCRQEKYFKLLSRIITLIHEWFSIFF